MTTDIIIYHNPECGTSRNALAMIRNAGIEPHVIDYLKTPPSRAMLVQLIERARLTPRQLLREKGTPYAELGLDDDTLSDDALVYSQDSYIPSVRDVLTDAGTWAPLGVDAVPALEHVAWCTSRLVPDHGHWPPVAS